MTTNTEHTHSKRYVFNIATIGMAIIALCVSAYLIVVGHLYSIALFVLVSVFIGIGPVLYYCKYYTLTKRKALVLAATCMGYSLLGFFALGVEGIICIAMALPFVAPIVLLSAYITILLVSKNKINHQTPTIILLFTIPLVAFIEQKRTPPLHKVTTGVVIAANKETVWKNVVSFPPIEEPDELIFKTGIAYPQDAHIEGEGVGAIRYCNFNTGPFVEPITVWDQPNLLKFSVTEQPVPMNEISFISVDAPHLYGYFGSKEGQFELTKLANGNTLLEGTTWYYLDIYPGFYWKWWSDAIIHVIHKRVLNHIKTNAESQL